MLWRETLRIRKQHGRDLNANLGGPGGSDSKPEAADFEPGETHRAGASTEPLSGFPGGLMPWAGCSVPQVRDDPGKAGPGRQRKLRKEDGSSRSATKSYMFAFCWKLSAAWGGWGQKRSPRCSGV